MATVVGRINLRHMRSQTTKNRNALLIARSNLVSETNMRLAIVKASGLGLRAMMPIVSEFQSRIAPIDGKLATIGRHATALRKR